MAHLILLRSARELGVSTGPHLSVDDVAGLIDGTLAAHERERAERHLATCDECREELAACTRVVASSVAAPVRRFPWRHLLPLAAGILLVVWIRRPADRAPVASAAERGAPSVGSRIATIAPATDAAVSATALRFTWHPLANSIGYRLVVKDASGATVWSGDVADTALALPDSVHLQANVPYVWRVDGQRADGTTAASAESGFRVAP